MIEPLQISFTSPLLRTLVRLGAVLLVILSPFLVYLSAERFGSAVRPGQPTQNAAAQDGYESGREALPPGSVAPTRPSSPLTLDPVPPLAPAEVTVQVFNAGAPEGSATALSATLARQGFVVLGPRNSPSRLRVPVSVYYRHDRPKARTVADRLGGVQVSTPIPPYVTSQAEVVVILGSVPR